jgi:hypothetical protein
MMESTICLYAKHAVDCHWFCTGIRRSGMYKVKRRGDSFRGARLRSFFRSLLVQLFVMRLYALSIYAAVGLTISTAAMPTGSPPCHDESVMPDKTLPYLSLPPQTSYTEKPYLPYAASLSPPPAPKVESPKPEQKSYPPAQAPKPYLEKLTPEKPYATPPLRKEENPYAAPPFPLLSKEEVSKSKEKSCTLGLVPEPYPEKPKSVSKEGRYRRQEKSYSPPPPPPPPHSQPYSEMTKSEAKPKPWAKTKPEVKPKPEVKSYQRKQPYFEEKGKSDKKQKPQDHYTKVIRVPVEIPSPSRR